jgi:uncharacterized protein YuzE
MQITYTPQHDLLYIQFDSRRQPIRNERMTDDIVLDIGDEDRIVGIEILDASKHIRLDSVLPVQFASVD